MTGRRLLDVAAIFKASQGVAAKHVALRQHQLDVYSKTSSLAKAIKSQTDRVTLTVKAASDLAERFSEPGPNHSTQASQSGKPPPDTSIRGQDLDPGVNKNLEKKYALSQEHDSEISDQNAPAELPADSSIATKQAKAKEYPLPDGLSLPVDPVGVSSRDRGSYSEQVVSALPRVSLPKNTEDTQDSDEHVPDAELNQDVFYSASSKNEEQPLPQAQAIPEQDQLPDEAYTELFHSPRVARMLSRRPKLGTPSKGLEMPGAQETPVKQTKRPQEKDQVSSGVRTLAQESQDRAPSPPSDIVGSRPSRLPQAKGSEDVHNLAADMAKDAGAMPADSSQINRVRVMSMTLMLVD